MVFADPFEHMAPSDPHPYLVCKATKGLHEIYPYHRARVCGRICGGGGGTGAMMRKG